MNCQEVKLSSKSQITISKSSRQKLRLKPGDRIRLETHEGYIKLFKQPSIEDYYGKLDGFWGSDDPAEELREWRARA